MCRIGLLMLLGCLLMVRFSLFRTAYMTLWRLRGIRLLVLVLGCVLVVLPLVVLAVLTWVHLFSVCIEKLHLILAENRDNQSIC